MSENKELKSAFELAMERLQQKDAEAGIERKPLRDEQKAEIAEIRRTYEAKLAELDLRHQDKRTALIDPLQADAENAEYRRERERLTAERDRKIEKIRAS
ncbi:MAG TPA: hypothetical protein VJP86_11580 [Vicinamibacterales bacterium]|jgi:hypothetical protein|nr:hypothetical protein [Vicinamibacterales bacterium]